VATLGTACTADHVAKLFRFTDSVIFSFDGDAAGRRAARRALEAALPHATDTRSIRFLFLPAEHDPDSFIREFGSAAFERQVLEAVPLSKQLIEQARDDVDLSAAEGRARLLANARPLWSALPDAMLKRQLLGDLAAAAATPASELAQLWGTTTPAARRPPPSASASPHRRAPVSAARRPEDHAARTLLLESRWWDEIGPADHELLCQLGDWHGELFRWLDRVLAERGALPWAALREGLAGQPFAVSALALVDLSDASIEPVVEDLRGALSQLRTAPGQREAWRALGRL